MSSLTIVPEILRWKGAKAGNEYRRGPQVSKAKIVVESDRKEKDRSDYGGRKPRLPLGRRRVSVPW